MIIASRPPRGWQPPGGLCYGAELLHLRYFVTVADRRRHDGNMALPQDSLERSRLR